MAQVTWTGIIFHLNYPCQPSGIQSPREGTNLTLLWSLCKPGDISARGIFFRHPPCTPEEVNGV